MKRTLLVVLGLALCASAASADPSQDCRKSKATFAGSTAASVTDSFGVQTAVDVKKVFLYCEDAALNTGAAGAGKTVCYKVKGTKAPSNFTRSSTDVFGALTHDVKNKTFVLCVPAT